ncbi:MAG: YggS family pyridoxal phosphate-dependent enzyme [Pseudomonadota bacterium]
MDRVSRWRQVCADIDAASAPGKSVTLVAVSKTYDAEAIWPVIEAGQRVFGENRVQEAMVKWPALRERAPEPLELHLIGPLQSNKATDAVATFDVIQSVDREKIAKVLASEMTKQGRHLPVFVQVNTGREPQKAGVDPDEAVSFAGRCREVYGLAVLGFMCIPPFDEDAAAHFDLLASLAGQAGLPMRSMGMSSDYTQAIERGATHVRVGSAIFGARS